MATYGNGLKVYGAATSGGTVPANSFAICTYTASSGVQSVSTSTGISWSTSTASVIRIVSPGTIPATFTAQTGQYYGASSSSPSVTQTTTYTFRDGIILTNS